MSYHLDRQIPPPVSQLDKFAELICGGRYESSALSPQDAAERMGLARRRGNQLMQELRREMGIDWAV